jgi:uncharacterized protein (DUF58 family)
MITPTTRLIAFAALLALPFTALAAIWPPALLLAVLLVGALAFVAAIDASRASAPIRGIGLDVPEYSRLQKRREGEFSIKFLRAPGSASRIRVGISFPVEFDAPDSVRDVELATDASTLAWRCTPRERGLFLLETLVLGAESPLGLWFLREARPIHHELRVYPDLLAERQRVAALFLRRGMEGSHAQRRAGQGREFEKLRDYSPGDSLGDVHWKASGKRRHLVTKVHQVERSHEVYVVIDASRLSAREVPSGTPLAPPVPALDRYVTAALILGAAAERQGDQFGLITFSDRIHTFLRARNGQAHYDTCRDCLYTLKPQPVTPDYEEICSIIRSRLRRRALLIFLTALDDPFLAESFTTASELIARQHLLLVNMLRPPGARPVFENAAVKTVNDLYAELGHHLQWDKLRELERVLRRRGIRFGMLDPVMIAAELVNQHANVRARELV